MRLVNKVKLGSFLPLGEVINYSFWADHKTLLIHIERNSIATKRIIKDGASKNLTGKKKLKLNSKNVILDIYWIIWKKERDKYKCKR